MGISEKNLIIKLVYEKKIRRDSQTHQIQRYIVTPLFIQLYII